MESVRNSHNPYLRLKRSNIFCDIHVKLHLNGYQHLQKLSASFQGETRHSKTCQHLDLPRLLSQQCTESIAKKANQNSHSFVDEEAIPVVNNQVQDYLDLCIHFDSPAQVEINFPHQFARIEASCEKVPVLFRSRGYPGSQNKKRRVSNKCQVPAVGVAFQQILHITRYVVNRP